MEAYYLLYPDGYHCFNQNGYMQAVMNNEQRAKNWVENWNKYNVPNTLAPTTCTSNTVPCQKGNNPMSDCCYTDMWAVKSTPKNAAGAGSVSSVILNAGPDDVQEQRKYLERRLYDVRYEKRNELAKQFFIGEPEAPKTAQEVLDRLKAGQYTVKVPKNPDDNDDDFDGFYWRDVFSWRTPETQPDKAGYEAAEKAFMKAYEDTVDTIAIVSPEEGLKALRALQDWKPAGPSIVAKVLG